MNLGGVVRIKSSLLFKPSTVQTLPFGDKTPKELIMKIKKIAVIVICTNTGNEDKFKRCMNSLKSAQLVANPELEVKYFKGSSREKILKRKIEEISECDLVTFVNENDYVEVDFFNSLPREFKGDEIFAFDSCYPIVRLAERVDTISEEDLICLKDYHLWGYFFPARMIESLTKSLLINLRPEIISLDDECYWSWIVTNPKFDFRFVKLDEPHCYHEG